MESAKRPPPLTRGNLLYFNVTWVTSVTLSLPYGPGIRTPMHANLRA